MTDPYERYLDDFGERLARTSPPHRSRTPALAAGALALAAVVAALLLLPGTRAGRRLDVVAEARAALAPPGEVVHLRIVTGASRVGLQPLLSRKTDQWSAVDPPRWRIAQTLSGDGSAQVFNGLRSPVSGRQEVSYAHGVERTYLAEHDLLTRVEGFSDSGPAAKVPSPLGGDPATDLRALLSHGRARDAGVVRVGGRDVRRIVVEQASSPRLRSDLTYDVDPTTFAPIRGVVRVRFLPPGDRRHPRPRPLVSAVTFTVTAYERISLDATSAKLLRIQTTPRTKVVVVTAAQRRRKEGTKAMGGRCRRSATGATVCALRVRRAG